jgi:hypothetical protein
MTAFDKTYWDKNYSDPMSMDGIGNAKDHVKYLKAFFEIEHVDIGTIIDLDEGVYASCGGWDRTFSLYI